ncbi:hypothetical protein DHEL01_v204899 [Diaporthe helianthi]|uniref:Uncharacterized protein n=1 Tax=Diaporthe helianthi TaxID=158607 RepID=A0A2P5I2K0_DIAHE|nr:hypothetical protein DHEL01_v204899 [Diaporthe helianthi]
MDYIDPTGLEAAIKAVDAVVLTKKPLSISDLPNEVLDKIMLQVSRQAHKSDGTDPSLDVSSAVTNDLKNVRLSCKALDAAASRYLIKRVKVHVSQGSLAHLEEICEHPLFSKGVRIIHICLAQYDDFFDDGIKGFTRFTRDRLPYLRLPLTEATSTDEMRMWVARCWSTYATMLESESEDLLGTFDDEFKTYQDFKHMWDIGYNGLLLEGYHLYRSRLREQTSLQQDDFVARVSAALAKLPFAEHLQITDWDTTAWGHQPGAFGYPMFGLDLSSSKSIIASLAESRYQFENVQGTSLLPMIPRLICAFKNLKSLDIQISPSVAAYAQLRFSPAQEAHLRSSLKDLHSFKFDNYRFRTTNPWNELLAARPLGHFLDACLVSDKLEHLFINAKIRHPYPTRSLFSLRPWPKLQSAVLESLPVSAADLDMLTESLAFKETKGSLTLRYVNVYCGGTWANILDILRNRYINVDLGDSQRGAEFETDPALCDLVFEHNREQSTGFYVSFAEFYVRGVDMANPLVETPDESLRDRLFGYLGPVHEEEGIQ